MIPHSQPVKLAIVLRLLVGTDEQLVAILNLLNLSAEYVMIDKSVLPDRIKTVLRNAGTVLR